MKFPRGARNFLKILRQDSFSRIAVVNAILLIIVSSVVIGFHIVLEKKSMLAQKKRDLSPLAQTFSEHVIRTFDGADQTLRYIRREYQDWKYVGSLRRIADDANAVTMLFNQIAIADEEGRVVATSVPMPAAELAKVDLRDRPHFKFHQNDNRDVPRVGEPLVGRVSNKASIQLSRRISDPNGVFKGMIVTSVAPDYFSDFFKKIVQVSNGSIGVTLVGYDGIVRARASGAKSDFGQKTGYWEGIDESESGDFIRISSIDNKLKLFSFQKIPAYQLAVLVWVDYGRLEEEWINYSVPYLAFELLLILVVSMGCFLLLRNRKSQLDYVDRLLHREEDLKKANAFQARMISSVSHELRTPLTSILGYGSLVADSDGGEEIREYGKIICGSADHLKNVINGILDLSRKEAGKLSVLMEQVSIKEVLQKSIELFKVNALEKGLNLELDFGADCPEFVQLDRTKFVQIIENLLSNAIKFTFSGYVRLAAHVVENGKQLEITVEDSGLGVPSHDVGRLFEPFYYVKDEWHKKQRGAGLGLNIVKEFSELMGGSVAVESEVGRGTKFTIKFRL
jgi:two-component system sensor histidine kinase BarA